MIRHFIIFGASGDLTSRKLVPALYRLTQERLLPAEFAIVGFSRSPIRENGSALLGNPDVVSSGRAVVLRSS